MKATTKAQAESQQTGAKKAAADPKPERQPMGSDSDPTLAESVPMAPRMCQAAQRLITEVEGVFTSTSAEATADHVSPRGVSLQVRFENRSQDIYTLLTLITSDDRVARVEGSPAGHVVYVTFKGWPTTMDDRSPFGLHEAMAILNEEDDDDGGE